MCRQVRLELIAVASVCVFGLLAVALAPAQQDVADVPSQDLRAGGDQQMRYFLIGPKAGAVAPEDGYGLVVVLPGGAGGADFHPFVKRIFKYALPDRYLLAQPVAVKWNPAQGIVWPTRKHPTPSQKFATEDFVAAVIDDVKSEHKLNHRHIFTLSWSSGGPAAYAVSLSPDSKVTGSYVAMSVFHAGGLPALSAAKGHAYFLDHSPDDQVCRFFFARRAREKLSAAGARVKLVTYEGGHGWHGDVWGRIRRGIDWLEEGEPPDEPTTKPTTQEKPAIASAEPGKNLMDNGGFEQGTEGWLLLNNSGRATMEIDRRVKKQGEQSLRISKTGGMPFDVARYDVRDLPAGGRVTVSAMVKPKGVKNSFLKFFIYDEAGESLVEKVDIKRIVGGSDWKRVSKTFKVPTDAASGAVMFVMVLDGTVWLDDVRVTTR